MFPLPSTATRFAKVAIGLRQRAQGSWPKRYLRPRARPEDIPGSDHHSVAAQLHRAVSGPRMSRRKAHDHCAAIADSIAVRGPVGRTAPRARIREVLIQRSLRQHCGRADHSGGRERELERKRGRRGRRHGHTAKVPTVRLDLLYHIVSKIGDEDVPSSVHRYAFGPVKAIAQRQYHRGRWNTAIDRYDLLHQTVETIADEDVPVPVYRHAYGFIEAAA